jgi:hypothetical protein
MLNSTSVQKLYSNFVVFRLHKQIFFFKVNFYAILWPAWCGDNTVEASTSSASCDAADITAKFGTNS